MLDDAHEILELVDSVPEFSENFHNFTCSISIWVYMQKILSEIVYNWLNSIKNTILKRNIL